MHLVERLIHELNVTRQQAEGGLGLLLEQAQSRLTAEQFLQLANAIPAVSDLVGKTPRQPSSGLGPLRRAWQQCFSGWGKLAPLRSRSEDLGLDHAAIDQFIAVISSYFQEQGQTEVDSLLLGTWR